MSEKVTPKQRRAVEALLISPDMGAAAAAVGVTRKTLYKWLKQSAFKTLLAEAEAAALAKLSRSLVRLGDKAAATLETAMDDASATAGQRVRAADIVLSRLLQLRELVDLTERLNELERTMMEGKQDEQH